MGQHRRTDHDIDLDVQGSVASIGGARPGRKARTRLLLSPRLVRGTKLRADTTKLSAGRDIVRSAAMYSAGEANWYPGRAPGMPIRSRPRDVWVD